MVSWLDATPRKRRQGSQRRCLPTRLTISTKYILLHASRHSPPVCGLRQVCNNLKLLRASNTHPNVGYQCTVASEERPEVSRRRITRRPHSTSNSTARCWMTCPYRTQVLHIGDTQHQPNNTLLLSNVAECLDGDIRFEDRHKLGAQGLKPQIACHALFAMEQPIVAHTCSYELTQSRNDIRAPLLGRYYSSWVEVGTPCMWPWTQYGAPCLTTAACPSQRC